LLRAYQHHADGSVDFKGVFWLLRRTAVEA